VRYLPIYICMTMTTHLRLTQGTHTYNNMFYSKYILYYIIISLLLGIILVFVECVRNAIRSCTECRPICAAYNLTRVCIIYYNNILKTYALLAPYIYNMNLILYYYIVYNIIYRPSSVRIYLPTYARLKYNIIYLYVSNARGI